MLQVINHLSRGTIELSDVPCPSPNLGAALIRTHPPDGVSDDAASFTVIDAIALQGVRLAVPSLGLTSILPKLTTFYPH